MSATSVPMFLHGVRHALLRAIEGWLVCRHAEALLAPQWPAPYDTWRAGAGAVSPATEARSPRLPRRMVLGQVSRLSCWAAIHKLASV